jgi:putative aldouronate transport system substrate-binding protein
MNDRPVVNRRQLLQGFGAVSAAAILSACGSSKDGSSDTGTTAPAAGGSVSASVSAPTSGSSAAPGESALPTYVAYPGVEPYYRAANQYEVNGFLRYPSPAPRAVPEPPGKGGSVTVEIATQAGTPKPMSSNRWWQAVNKRLGVELKMSMAPATEYSAKIETLIAGGDLPDMVRFNYNPTDVDKVLPAKFAPLNDYLSGDLVKDYPVLANIPTMAWKTVEYSNTIYGVPMPVLPIFANLIVRSDIAEGLKLNSDVGSADEFLEFCRGLTDEKKSRWAWCRTLVEGFLTDMFGAPSNWRVDAGKFVKDIESDEYSQALDFAKRMWNAGVMYPDTFTGGGNDPTLFSGGRACMFTTGGSSLVKGHKDAPIALIAPPKAAGGGPAGKALGSGVYGFTAINKNASPDRIKELLSILNLLGGPFGTSEYLLVNYGEEGVDYTLDPATGNPATTDSYKPEQIPVNYLPGGGSDMVFYSGDDDESTKKACAYEAKVSKNVVADPTVGLFSATYGAKSTSLNTAIYAAEADVIVGRKSLADWKDVVATWRKNGGDDSRKEYEAAYAQSH